MGVGVYSDDFNGTGGTFCVSGPLATNDDYQEYLDNILAENPHLIIEEVADGDWNFRSSKDAKPPEGDSYWELGRYSSKNEAIQEACDYFDIHVFEFEAWSQDQYDTFNSDLIEIVKQAGDDLGLERSSDSDLGSRKLTRACFDDDFCELVKDPQKNMFAIGWRSWEHDFVIGIGANNTYDWQEHLSEPMTTYKAIQILEYSGKSPNKFITEYQEMIAAVEEYVRIILMESNIECSYKTSGYTTSPYSLPEQDQLESKKAELKATVNKWQESLYVEWNDALTNATAQDRLEILKAIDDNQDNQERFHIEVPIFNHADGTIYWIMPTEDGEVITNSVDSGGFKELMKDQPQTEGFSIIPRNERTESWFKSVQARINSGGRNAKGIMRIAFSGDEYTSVTKNDIVINFGDLKIELSQPKRTKMRM